MAGTERVSEKEDNQSCTLNTILSKEMQKPRSSFNATVQAERYAKINKCYLEEKALGFCYILNI